MSSGAAELARRLARDAEAVCRHYLDNGCRHGRYWVVGDVDNTPGRSLYVRLDGPDCGTRRRRQVDRLCCAASYVAALRRAAVLRAIGGFYAT